MYFIINWIFVFSVSYLSYGYVFFSFHHKALFPKYPRYVGKKDLSILNHFVEKNDTNPKLFFLYHISRQNAFFSKSDFKISNEMHYYHQKTTSEFDFPLQKCIIVKNGKLRFSAYLIYHSFLVNVSPE